VNVSRVDAVRDEDADDDEPTDAVQDLPDLDLETPETTPAPPIGATTDVLAALTDFSSQYVISAAVEYLPARSATPAPSDNGRATEHEITTGTVAAVEVGTVAEEQTWEAPDEPAEANLPSAASDAPPSSVDVETPRLHEAKSQIPAPHFTVAKPAEELREPPLAAVPSSLPREAGPGFNPSWEVDAFMWPELTDRLLRRETRRFTLLTEKLADVARSGRNVVAVTSPVREQGRTTLALCLARRAAAAGLNVAVVDADFENPCLAQRLRVNPTCGWQDTLAARLPLAEAAVHSTRDGVTLLPLRVASIGRDDDAALDPTAVTELIDQLSRCFDLVILDMEPVDAEEVSDTADATEPESAASAGGLHAALVALLVVDPASDERQLHSAVAQLRSARIETLGVVENFFTSAVGVG
jgi:Mrp family chromosome partitioning ATPase